MARYYKQSYSRTARRPSPLDLHVPTDWVERLRQLRRACGFTQTQLAEMIGAANKALVYQWESGKRKPSPAFWRRIDELTLTLDVSRKEPAA